MTKQIQNLAALLLLLPVPAPLLAQPDPSPPEMLPDAELTAVTFFDADRGWAVGDRGVIWHTSDGGRNWKLQNSGVTCRLEAVQFLDADIGFAVGGWTQPYTHESHGVILRTRDGGRTWQNTPGLMLPGLRHVRFFDTRQGWAIGDGSSLFPAGVFRSDDGGRSWSSLAKGATAGWVTGDFRDAKSGAVAGLDGKLAIVTSNELRSSRTPSVGARYLERIILAGDNGWLVGAGGLVLTTSDGGLNWTSPPGSLPEGAASTFDFCALAVKGNHVWIAGAPGTCVLHSPDAGQTWQLFRTEQTAPLRGLWFIDEYRGWAVGSLGTILHTRDGGQTWRVQHSGGTRVALLGIFSQSQRIPLELIASQAGSEAYLTAVEIVGRRDQDAALSRTNDSSARGRTQLAVVAAGGSASDAAWRFPLADPGLSQSAESILARWNLANDGKATERLEEHLVRRIRQWRPDVIVTEDLSPRGDDPLAHLTNQVTLAAVAKAAEPAAYPDQLSRAALSPWQVKKVLAVIAGEKPGQINLVPAQWDRRLGRSLAEQAEAGRSLIARDVQIARRNVGLSLLVDRLPQDSGKREVMSGLVLPEGCEARRKLSHPPQTDLDTLSKMAQKRHNVEQLLERIETDATMGAGWIGQAADLTKGLSNGQAGEILWQLGRKYQQVGKSEQAAEAFNLLLEKHPQHPLADAAALWLVQYYASGEIAWRQRKETKYEVRLATATNSREERAATIPAGEDAKAAGPAGQSASLASVGSRATAAPEMHPQERAGRALALAKQIEQIRPTLYADPTLRFMLAAAARHSGQQRAADRFLQNLANAAPDSTWAQNVAAEKWLVQPSGNPPKKICSVVTAVSKPKLDGRLDDPVWKVAKPVSLKSTAGGDTENSAAAVLAFDEEFLYIALSCRKAAGVDYAAAQPATRTSDSDLTNRDRVTIMFDVDRDYASFWSLTIDHRGWPAESCFGDATWNPQWFIAAGGDEQYWTVEIAIPLAELGPKKPQVRDVWALGIQRIIPRVGLQSFTTPAAVEPRPEGFGLMVFE